MASCASITSFWPLLLLLLLPPLLLVPAVLHGHARPSTTSTSRRSSDGAGIAALQLKAALPVASSTMHADVPTPPLAPLLLLPAPTPFEAAAPWTAPPGTLFPYSHLENDLTRLLAVQASEHRWISMLVMTAKIKRFLVNCVYTLQKYGGQRHYIVAVFDQDSIEECKRLNLPCFNAGAFSQNRIKDGTHTFGTEHMMSLCWGKIALTRELISRGYHVHGSDVDVVYLRNVNKSYDRLLSGTRADAIFGAEESAPPEPWDPHGPDRGAYINMVNAGVFAITASNRSLAFLDQWTIPQYESFAASMRVNDQAVLNNLHTEAYVFCNSRVTCRSAQAHGRFTLFRHQFFFPGSSCAQDFVPPHATTSPCDTRRLYYHFLCGCCWELKEEAWQRNHLWFVDAQLQPLYPEGGTKHLFMPCQEQVAWPDWQLYL